MDERRNKIIAGAVIGVLIAGAIVVIFVNSRSKVTCEFGDYEPSNITDFSTLQNFISDGMDNNMALVRMSAYLVYDLHLENQAPKKGYIQLGMDSVELKKLNEIDQLMTVSTNCSKIEFSLRFPKDKSDTLSVETTKIQVTLEVPSDNISSCQIDTFNDYPIRASKGYHYSCMERHGYPCVAKTKDNSGKEIDKTIAKLMFEALEFEAGVMIMPGFTTKGEGLCRFVS